MNNAIILCGQTGSGKTTLASHLSRRYAVPHVEVSDLVVEDFQREYRTQAPNEKLFDYVAQTFASQSTHTRFAKLALQRVRDRWQKASLALVSGFRTPAEVKAFARECDSCRVAYLRCPQEVRRERKAGTKFGLDFDDRDQLEEQWGISWLEAMADVVIDTNMPLVECEEILAALVQSTVERNRFDRPGLEFMITIGPNSWAPSELRKLLRHRVRFVRFPFAKEDHRTHAENAARVRSVAAELGVKAALVADLPGGKPRLSNEEPREVESHEALRVALRPTLREIDLSVDPPLDYSAKAGDIFAVGDGELEFVVNRVDGEIVHGKFLRGGTLERRRAFIPRGVNYDFDSFTDADKLHATAARNAGFDAIAISFVTGKASIANVKDWLRTALDWSPLIIAKIETTKGVEAAHEIAAEVDAVVVGRGDLLLESSAGKLWHLQSAVLRACRSLGKPGFVGTGVLESMKDRPFPTRAEVIDLLAAAEMGATGVLFSAETTIGINPVAVLNTAERLTAGRNEW